jgi:hypothetical protein
VGTAYKAAWRKENTIEENQPSVKVSFLLLAGK